MHVEPALHLFTLDTSDQVLHDMSVAASSMHPGPRTSKMLIHQLKSLEASSHLGARDIAATPVSGHENGVANGNKGPLDVLYSAGGEGMTWRSPTPEEQRGGSWLVGYNVRVFWDDDQRYHRFRIVAPCLSAVSCAICACVQTCMFAGFFIIVPSNPDILDVSFARLPFISFARTHTSLQDGTLQR